MNERNEGSLQGLGLGKQMDQLPSTYIKEVENRMDSGVKTIS